MAILNELIILLHQYIPPHSYNVTCISNDMKKVLKLQYRSLKCVYNDVNLSYDVLRDKADVPLVYVHILRVMMTEMYTISIDLGPKYKHIYMKLTHIYSAYIYNGLEWYELFYIPRC